MSWRGPALDPEQQSVLELLDDLLADQRPLDDQDVEYSDRVKAQLVELGLWSLGVDESLGGSGAPRATVYVVLERLGRLWPALAWASVQAQAALSALGSDDRFTELAAAIADGSTGVAVVDRSSPHVQLTAVGDGFEGTLARVDTASATPAVVLLGPGDTATLLLPGSLTATPVERTGLGGARTIELTVNAWLAPTVAVDTTALEGLLRLGAGAIAAGITGAAADAALLYAANRDQFGGPLTDIPAVRHSLTAQAAGASTALGAVFGADPGESAQTAAALSLACDTAVDVAAAALQSHGGYGYLTEFPAERFVRDAVSLRAATCAGKEHS